MGHIKVSISLLNVELKIIAKRKKGRGKRSRDVH